MIHDGNSLPLDGVCAARTQGPLTQTGGEYTNA
jgi:hypothetical protein